MIDLDDKPYLGAYTAPVDTTEHSEQEMTTVISRALAIPIRDIYVQQVDILTAFAELSFLVQCSYDLPGRTGQKGLLTLVLYEQVNGSLSVSDTTPYYN